MESTYSMHRDGPLRTTLLVTSFGWTQKNAIFGSTTICVKMTAKVNDEAKINLYNISSEFVLFWVAHR